MENKTKKIYKNILLGIALLPYIIIMNMCIYYAITGYVYGSALGATAYGIEAMKCFIGDIYKAIWFSSNSIILLPLIILWIGYQLYYYITFEKTKKENNGNTTKNTNLEKILTFIFICCCIYFASGVLAIFFGSYLMEESVMGDRMLDYGWGTIPISLFLIVFNVLPILLLYKIIYAIVNKRKKKKEMTAKANIDETNIED